MLLGKNEVIEWIELNGTPFWNLRRTEKGGIIFVKKEPDNLTIEESKQALSHVLDMLEKGTYHIDAWGKDRINSTQWLRSGFRIGAVSGSGQENTAGVGSMEDIENRVMERLRKEMEFDRLKTENEELRREIDSVSHQVSRRLVPYIPHMIEGLFGTKIGGAPATQVAGIPEEDLEDDQKRLEEAFSKWFKVEKESSPVTIVEKIVELAQNDPQMYSKAKKLLFS
ncbi:hypothetical protein ES705_06379 [subsurface metagenome]